MKLRLIYIILLLLCHICLFFVCFDAFANNLVIQNTVLKNPNTQDKTVKVTFDISWNNSWKNQSNFDAVWVFLKYSTDGAETWKHATLSASGINPSGFSSGTGASLNIVVPQDKKGCFIQRNTMGQGTIAATSLALVWNWGADGLLANQSVRVKVLGVEMVYIPEKPFFIGDGNGTNESVYAYHENGVDNLSVQITTTPKSVTCDSNPNDDIDTSPISIDGDGGIAGNSSYPVGYSAFYAMKYEISEGQWVDFFNTLSSSEKILRDITGPDGKSSDAVVNRNTVSWASGNAVTSRPDRACSYLSWMDVAAYADWAALRPMTDLEYEKLCRGNAGAVLNEYAWGNTSLTQSTAISGTENGTETITTVNANSNFGSITFTGGDSGSGPLRVGINATQESNRVQAGAGYYGLMDMSGSLYERVTTIGNAAGRVFQGTNGDGVLSTDDGYQGNATNTDWPGIDSVHSRGITSSQGSGLRGGAWQSAASAALYISDRSDSSRSDSTRGASFGGRCVRTGQ